MNTIYEGEETQIIETKYINYFSITSCNVDILREIESSCVISRWN